MSTSFFTNKENSTGHLPFKTVKEGWRHEFTSLKKMHDRCYNKSDKAADSNYMNGIVFSNNKDKAVSRLFFLNSSPAVLLRFY